MNRRLDRAGQKDVYIYVHGYKVTFDNPVLVAAEMWHFMGYEGVFIAYSWPATPEATAYSGDVDTAMGMARNLRELVHTLETETRPSGSTSSATAPERAWWAEPWSRWPS